MAAPDISAVVALCNKAFDLHRVGHVARYREYLGRALAAAQALGAVDCLIVAALQLDVAGEAIFQAEETTADAAQRARLSHAALEDWAAAVATVQRRRAAGTLLACACRSVEEAWHAQTQLHALCATRPLNVDAGAAPDATAPLQTAILASCARLVGYDLLMRVADLSCVVIELAVSGKLTPTPAQLRAALTLAADAAAVLNQSPVIPGQAMPSQPGFLRAMVRAVDRIERALKEEHNDDVEAAAVRVVFTDLDGFTTFLAAWQLHVVHSDVTCRPGMELGALQLDALQQSCAGAAAAAAAAHGLRCCGLASCGAREAHPRHFKSCAACRVQVYCCKQHQTEDWPRHKAACKAARRAAAEQQHADGAGGSAQHH